jgi:DNA-binding transcriptional regulator YhcF (GntR family)
VRHHAAGETTVRRYSDREVEEIVRQAAEEQLAHPTEEGLSLKTVQQIADDVGISPERVARAARKLESRQAAVHPAERGAGAFWLGSSTVIEWERIVPGEVTQSVYDEIVAEVQATFSAEGHATTLARSLTWRATKPKLGQTRAVQVHVSPRAGQTRIHVQERLFELGWTVFPTVWGIGGGGIAVILSLLGPELGWTAAGLGAAAWTGGMYALSRKIFQMIARRKRRDLEKLGDRIAETVAESARGRLDDGKTTRAIPG